MKVIVELEIEKCEECPHFTCTGYSWNEPCYECKKSGRELVDGDDIPNHCPLIESTMERLRELSKK